MSDPENKTFSFELDVDVGLLIKLVQNFPYLYNNQLAEFKNVSLRQRTWSKIADTLKVPVDDCQRLWRNLRDKYGKEKRLNLEYPESRGSKWEFYDSMHFLKPFVRRRRRARRIHRRLQNKIVFQEDSTEDVSNSSHAEIIWEPTEVTLTPKDIAILKNELEDNDETDEITLEDDITNELPIKQINVQEDTVNIVRHQSSEEAFGAYVASRLMDFDLDDRQAKKVKIFKILEDLDELS